MKGLGVSIKNLMSVHPILLAKLDILSPFIPAVFTMHSISNI